LIKHYPASKIKWLIPGKLAKASTPDDADLMNWKSEGITSVVNLLETSFEDVLRAEKNAGFKVLHSPVDDFGAPELEQLKEVVSFINKDVSAGGKVLVHCFAGIGRTGTVLIAYLLNKGMEMSLAIEKVQSLGASPQSDKQRAVLNKYCNEFSELEGRKKTAKGQYS
jgi:atypical dual specificity phosphatase